jgi:transposase
MPALVAARLNPDMKAKYAHLIETGKPAKVALTAIMRKLVVLANALLKANRPRRQKPLDQYGYSRLRPVCG